nr:unnamed protein product [Digitaria exilis]
MGGVGEKIMVSALTGVMRPVLGKLTNLIEKKYTELKNVRKKLELLREELMAIDILLEKYATIERPDVQVKAWVTEMREMAYDMEDIIDRFSYQVDHEPADTTIVKRFFRKKIRRLKKLHYRYRFAEEIKELLSNVKAAKERRERHKIEENGPSILHTEIDPRLEALYVEVEKLVGIENPRQEVIGRLVGKNPEERRRVVSIVGPGGSGKTTLAKQVYEKIKGQFSHVAFVFVSQKPNMNNLLRELQYQTGVPGSMVMGPCSDSLLIDQLRSYLENKRYLRFGGAIGLMLPAQIGNLQYLQTLDLSGAKATQLPKSIVQLKRLVCLVGYQLIMPDGFGNMESLQELGNLDGCKCSISFGEDLALLSKLRVLRVTFMWGSTACTDAMRSLASKAISCLVLRVPKFRMLSVEEEQS